MLKLERSESAEEFQNLGEKRKEENETRRGGKKRGGGISPKETEKVERTGKGGRGEKGKGMDLLGKMGKLGNHHGSCVGEAGGADPNGARDNSRPPNLALVLSLHSFSLS